MKEVNQIKDIHHQGISDFLRRNFFFVGLPPPFLIHKKTISKLFANVYCDVTSYEILWSMSVREYWTKCQYEWFTPLRALLCCIKLHRGTLIFKIYFNSKFNKIRFTRPYYCYYDYNKVLLPKKHIRLMSRRRIERSLFIFHFVLQFVWLAGGSL